jgi:hypothetical protein
MKVAKIVGNEAIFDLSCWAVFGFELGSSG